MSQVELEKHYLDEYQSPLVTSCVVFEYPPDLSACTGSSMVSLSEEVLNGINSITIDIDCFASSNSSFCVASKCMRGGEISEPPTTRSPTEETSLSVVSVIIS